MLMDIKIVIASQSHYGEAVSKGDPSALLGMTHSTTAGQALRCHIATSLPLVSTRGRRSSQ